MFEREIHWARRDRRERERERQRETRRVVLYFLYKVINANVKVAFVRVGWAMRQISYDLYIIIMPYFIDR